MWDYQRLSLESAHVDSKREISALEFLGDYPLLLGTDVTGRIRGWLARPAMTNDTRAVFNVENTWKRKGKDQDNSYRRFSLNIEDPTCPGDVVTASVTVLCANVVHKDDRIEMFTGDEWGVIKR